MAALSSDEEEFSSQYFETPTVRLKTGITIDQVKSSGAVFEIDSEDSRKRASSYSRPQELDSETCETLSSAALFGDDDLCSSTGESPFQILAKKMVKITDDGYVMKREITRGFGDLVPEGSLVRVHYSAYLEDTDEPFDSTHLRRKTELIQLGKACSCLPGVHAALLSMRKGGHAQFLIAPQYAYGEMGCPPRIPENATVLFDIRVIDFMAYGAPDTDHLNEETGTQSTFDHIKQQAMFLRQEGNDLAKTGNYKYSMEKYYKALHLVENSTTETVEDESLMRNLCIVLFLNISYCAMNMGNYVKTCKMCMRVLRIDPSCIKALYRMGKAKRLLKDFKDAQGFLERAQLIKPSDPEINEELRKLEMEKEKFLQSERDMYARMLGNKPNPTNNQHSQEPCRVDPDFAEEYEEQFKAMQKNTHFTERHLLGMFTADEMHYLKQLGGDLGLIVKGVQAKEDWSRYKVLVQKRGSTF